MDIKFLYLDTETTGLDAERNGLVQVSAIMVIGGKEEGEIDLLVRPFEGAAIEDKALEVNRRTRQEIAAFPEEREQLAAFTKWMDEFVDRFDAQDKAFLVGYNVAFDDAFLRKWFERNGNKFRGSYLWNDNIDVRGICALRYAHSRHLLPNFKLETVANYVLGEKTVAMIGSEAGGLHNSLADIRITRALLRAA